MQLTRIVLELPHHFVISKQIHVYLVSVATNAVIQLQLAAIINVLWNALRMMIAQNAREGHFARLTSRLVLNAYSMTSAAKTAILSATLKIIIV